MLALYWQTLRMKYMINASTGNGYIQVSYCSMRLILCTDYRIATRYTEYKCVQRLIVLYVYSS